MPTVHTWFEGPTDALDAFTQRLRAALGDEGRVFELRPGASPRERTLAVEVHGALSERQAAERVQRLIRATGGLEMLRGGDVVSVQDALPQPWRHRAA